MCIGLGIYIYIASELARFVSNYNYFVETFVKLTEVYIITLVV